MYTRKIAPAPAAENFDFPRLVTAAIDRERPKPPCNIPSDSKPPSPLTSPELEPVVHDLQTTITHLPPLSLESNSQMSTSLRVNPQHITSPSPSSSTSSILTNAQRKKINMKSFRQLKRAREKISTPHHPSTVRAWAINKHIRPSSPAPVDFDAFDLKHTEFGWTGKNDSVKHKQIYSLEEMVGPDSLFDFKLEPWDGK